MLQEERFNRILEELSIRGAVKSIDLSEILGVSESTVRRDINELESKGRLRKVFGGAVPAGSAVKGGGADGFVTDHEGHVPEKDAIARYAAGLIEDGDLVFIDAGSTTEKLVEYIDNSNASYMTNGLIHAQKLARRGLSVGIVSGKVKGGRLSVIGSRAVRSLESYNFTKCFMGTNGIDVEKGFTTPDLDEAMIKEEAVKRSKDVYVLADASKFDRVSSATFAGLTGTCIITDRLDNEAYRGYADVIEVL